MVCAETLRHEYLYGLPQQLFAVIAKRLFDLDVDQCDLALAVNHHHPVWSAFDDLTKLLLGALTFCDVAHDDRVEILASGFDLRDRSFDRKLLAISAPPVNGTRPRHGARRHARLAEFLDV